MKKPHNNERQHIPLRDVYRAAINAPYVCTKF